MLQMFKTILFPLSLLSVALVLVFSWKLLGLPPEEQLIEVAYVYFEKYGLITVFVSALLEGMLLVGIYYPGSLVIFLGVIFSIGNTVLAVETVATVITALFIGYSINYFLGKYGWYRLLLIFCLKKPIEEAQARVTTYGARAIYLSFWHPNIGAFTATAAGILQFPFRTFFIHAFIATVLWNSFWGIVVYIMGKASLKLMGLPFIISFVSLWIIFVIAKSLYEKRKSALNITPSLIRTDVVPNDPTRINLG